MEKGKLESLINAQMITLQREQYGRGAECAKTYIIDDMIIIRLKGTFTPAERQLVSKAKGKMLIKEFRNQMEEIIRPEIETMIEALTGLKVISLHNDISTKTGERIDIIVLEKKIKFDA